MDLVNHTWTQSFLLAGFTTTGALLPLAFLGTLCICISITPAGTCSSLCWFRQIPGCPHPCTSSSVSSPSWNSGMSAPQCPRSCYFCSMVFTHLTNLVLSPALCLPFTGHDWVLPVGCHGTGPLPLPSVASLPCSYEQTGTVMASRATWVAGFSAALVPASLTATLPLCFKEVGSFFCDLAPLMRLACVDTGVGTLKSTLQWLVLSMLWNLCSFGRRGILRAVLKLPWLQAVPRPFHLFLPYNCSGAILCLCFHCLCGATWELPWRHCRLIALVYTFLTPFLNLHYLPFRNKSERGCQESHPKH